MKLLPTATAWFLFWQCRDDGGNRKMILRDPAAVSRLSGTGSSYVVAVAWLLPVLCVSLSMQFEICLRSVLSNIVLCYIFWTFTLSASYPSGLCPRIPQLRSAGLLGWAVWDSWEQGISCCGCSSFLATLSCCSENLNALLSSFINTKQCEDWRGLWIGVIKPLRGSVLFLMV